MNVTGRVWLELTRDERMVVLRFATEENAKKWIKATAPTVA
ncbi:heme-degrading monooxygenase HmoA [Paenibacillus sp. DS2015]